MTKNIPSGPLGIALTAAMNDAKAAETAYYDDDDSDGERAAALLAAHQLADRRVQTARTALANSTELREWELFEEGIGYGTVMAESLEAALHVAVANVDIDNYGELTTSECFHVRVRCLLTGEEGDDEVVINPNPPDCADGDEHDWCSPHSVVGGLKENPGCFGSNHGGVRCTEVCRNCAIYRITDSGGTNRSNGTCMRTVAYEDADDESLTWAGKTRRSILRVAR